MALDPSVILQGQAPQIQNPLTAASQAATMSNLMQEHQMNTIKLNEAQRGALEQQTVRDSLKNNTQLDSNGTATTDRAGTIRDLTKAGMIQKAQELQLNWNQQDLEKLVKQHEIGSQIAMGINPNDESSFLRAQAQAKQFGLPDLAQQLPKFSDPNFPAAVNKFQVQMLSTKDRLEQQNKETGFQIERNKADVEKRRLDVEMAHYTNDKQLKAVEDFNTGVSGSRQQPDAAKELNNILSAKNINEIVAQAPGGDLNKLNNQQTKLAMMEVVKMAGGSVPTEGELETMTPNGIAQKYGGALQKLTNKSQPANAGEFLQQGIDYANGLSGVSQKALTKRSSEMLERLGPYMTPQGKSTIKNQIEHEFDDAKPAKKPGGDQAAKVQRLLELRAKASGG